MVHYVYVNQLKRMGKMFKKQQTIEMRGHVGAVFWVGDCKRTGGTRIGIKDQTGGTHWGFAYECGATKQNKTEVK